MPRKALHDESGVLLSHGFCDFVAGDGEFVRDVADEFDLEPKRWRWNGTDYEAYTPPNGSFLARDLIARLTVDDRIAIDRATRVRDPVSSDLATKAAQITLLWDYLKVQGDAPISVDSQRFADGWAALTEAIGASRAAELAADLAISVPPAKRG